MTILIRPSTQYEQIIGHVHSYGSISKREAAIDYDIYYLPRRIADIESRYGFNFKRAIRKHKVTGKEYMRYSFPANIPKEVKCIAEKVSNH